MVYFETAFSSARAWSIWSYAKFTISAMASSLRCGRAISASGMYVAAAVGPLGWHGGIKNSPYFAGLDALLWVDRLDGGGVVLQVVPRT